MRPERDNSQTDSALLKAWVNRRDREAIGQLISRHINFVYAVAFRQLRDAHLAEDVTQAVFILLLQKAYRIQSEAAMASWLFTTTRYAAANAMKMVRRRKYYEQQAARMAQTETTESASIDDEDFQPVLNDAINSLPKSDRACVIMSYLQQKTHQQIAASIGISEEAARKRVSRAVDRMREFLLSRSMTAPVAVIGTSLATQSAVSAQFIESTVNVATLSHAAIQMGSATAIAKGVSKMFFAMKVKAAAAIAVVIFGGAVTAQVVQNVLSHAAATAVTAQIQNPPAKDFSNISLGDGVIVNFVGVSVFPSKDDSWHTIDGKPMAKPVMNFDRIPATLFTEPAYQIVVRVQRPGSAVVRVKMLNVGRGVRLQDSASYPQFLDAFELSPESKHVDVEVDIADGPWKTLSKLDRDPSQRTGWDKIQSVATDNGGVSFSPAIETTGNATFYVTVENIESGQWRLVANDVSGLPHTIMPRFQNGAGKIMMGECAFDIPAALIASLEIQILPYSKRVTARNITIDPAKPTTPEIVVENPVKPQ